MAEQKYSKVIGIPDFVPNGKNVELENCINTEKYVKLVNEINGNSKLTDSEKKFLRLGATRWIQFRYDNIAQYFCTKANPEFQKMLQRLAMVLIDFDDVLENNLTEAQNFVYDLAKEQFKSVDRWDDEGDQPTLNVNEGEE